MPSGTCSLGLGAALSTTSVRVSFHRPPYDRVYIIPPPPAAILDWSKNQLLKHSTELMSLVGNYYSRISAKRIKELLGSSPIPTIVELQEAILDGKQVQGSEILLRLDGLRLRVQDHMHNLVVAEALQEIVDVLALVSFHKRSPLQGELIHRGSLNPQANKVYSEAQPWLLSTEPSQRAQIHAISVETLRICGILLQPFIPEKSVELLEALGTRPEERSWDYAEPGKGTTGDLKQGIRLFIDPTLLKKLKPELSTSLPSNDEKFPPPAQ